MATKTVICEITFQVFEPGDMVRASSPRSTLPGGVHRVTQFTEPLVPHELDGTVFIGESKYGHSAEYIILAGEGGDL